MQRKRDQQADESARPCFKKIRSENSEALHSIDF
jgi:hypothetical protein